VQRWALEGHPQQFLIRRYGVTAAGLQEHEMEGLDISQHGKSLQ
jgi:hypothetical protein